VRRYASVDSGGGGGGGGGEGGGGGGGGGQQRKKGGGCRAAIFNGSLIKRYQDPVLWLWLEIFSFLKEIHVHIIFGCGPFEAAQSKTGTLLTFNTTTFFICEPPALGLSGPWKMIGLRSRGGCLGQISGDFV